MQEDCGKHLFWLVRKVDDQNLLKPVEQNRIIIPERSQHKVPNEVYDQFVPKQSVPHQNFHVTNGGDPFFGSGLFHVTENVDI